MKKISFLMTLLALCTIAFTSCKDDTQPRLQKPTEFVLNTPPMAEQTYLLSENNGIDLTVSQPNYGMGVVTNYQVLVSFTPDFAEYQALESVDSQAKIACSGTDFSMAMCKLMGAVSEDTKDLFSSEAREVYVKVRAFIQNCDYSSIDSNVISLTVAPFFAVKYPGKIYCVGQPWGWNINNDEAPLVETEVDSQVFTGTYTIAPGEFQFRFYSVLGDWESNSIGAQQEDSPVDISFTDGIYEGPAVIGGKGSFQVPDFEGGDVKMTVDCKKAKVTFELL